MDGLDEIEEFEDLDDLDDGNKPSSGFQLFNAQPKASKVVSGGQLPVPKLGGLGLNSVTPLTTNALGGSKGGRKSTSYGKKIGFSDDFDDDWDESEK